MASRAHPVLPRLDAMEPDRPLPALVSELFEEIFLRVASPGDLARASAACVSFRRLITSPSFLRRYRSVHPPLLLGYFNDAGFLNDAAFHPVEATHPSAAVARAVARTADFSFDFLPTRRWGLHDVRDGRVLVGCKRMQINKSVMDMDMLFPRISWELAVCDPLARRYLLLPPITDDLLASVGLRNEDMFYSVTSFIHNEDMLYSVASLIPYSGMEEETSPSVICWMISMARSERILAVFIFSTSSGHWAVGASSSCADLGLSGEVFSLIYGQCVYGCFYWKVNHRNKLLKFDMNTKELSTYDFPPNHDERSIIIVEAGEGEVGMFSALCEGTSMEYYTFMQNVTEKPYEWHLKSTIPLPAQGTSKFFITGQVEGYVFLRHIITEQDTTYLEVLSLEVKSCNIERAYRTSATDVGHLYFGFLPSMLPRRIQGCRED